MPALVDTQLKRLLEGRNAMIKGIDEDCVQPVSIDIPIGRYVHWVTSQPPLGASQGLCMTHFIEKFGIYTFNLQNGPMPMVPGQAYIAEVDAHFNLPAGTWLHANPKSTTGRIFDQTRVSTERPDEFDKTPFSGYKGRLWIIINPTTFTTRKKWGTKLVQVRVYDQGRTLLNQTMLNQLQGNEGLVTNSDYVTPTFSSKGLHLHLELAGERSFAIANDYRLPVDWWEIGKYRPRDFFQQKPLTEGPSLVIEPGQSVLVCAKEIISVPPTVCSELQPMEWNIGTLQIHLAGFFDAGFGYHEDLDKRGASIVLEIINLGLAPQAVQDNQLIGYMSFEDLIEQPTTIYGQAGNSYQAQRGVRFAKQFSDWDLPV